MATKIRAKLQRGAEMNEKTEKTEKVRRQYDRAFKADTVRLVTEGGHRPSEVCREVGITTKMLSQWRRQLENHPTPEQAFVGQGQDREAEVKQLKRRITILEMERDILKKAIGIFVEPKR